MKYRLTVKGKVVVAAIAALAVLIPGSLAFGPERKLVDAPRVFKPTSGVEKAIEKQTATPKTEMKEATVRAEELSVMRQLHARIQFLPNQWENPSGMEQLDAFVRYAEKYPDVKVAVIGYINGYPDLKIDEFGKVLSEKRAQVVVQYLMIKGIAENRIVSQSKGVEQPVEQRDESNYWKNRRTEVYFIMDPQ